MCAPIPDFRDEAGTSMAAPHVAGLAAQLTSFGLHEGLPFDTPYIKATIMNNCRRDAAWAVPAGMTLDPARGAGEVDALESFRAYADELRVWQQRVTGTTASDSHWYWMDVSGAAAAAQVPVVVTLVFERHITDPTAAPRRLNNLDLRLLRPDATEAATSNSAVDSVEHIVFQATVNGRYCVEVRPRRLDTDNEELYAVAANFQLHFNGTTPPCISDFGDAPDPFNPMLNGYPTSLLRNGARHRDWTKEWLGSSRAEIDGTVRKGTPVRVQTRVDPFPSVSGETDADDVADQDGVPNLTNRDRFDDGVLTGDGPIIFEAGNPFVLGVTVQCTIDDTGFGPNGRYEKEVPTRRLYLNAWADWDGDGIWADPGEKIVGSGSPTGTVAIDPETFGGNGRFTPGEAFNDANGNGRWEPGETQPAGADIAGETTKQLQFIVVPPADIAKEFYVRVRLDYGEDAGRVANHSGDLDGPEGEARFGEVEDYRATARGACCNRDPFGLCAVDVLPDDCNCELCEWFPDNSCDDIDCAREAIPTLSQWGVLVMTLLLLIGAKVYFGRRAVRA
jgi:hypothetical protein